MKENKSQYPVTLGLNIFKEENFHSKELLGKGAQGQVFAGTFSHSKQKVAVKYLSDQVSEETFIKEISLMKKAKHSHVLPILGIMESKKEGFPYAIVTEFMDAGSLYDLLRVDQSFPWLWRLEIAINIAMGLRHIHSLNIIHGDLKSLNILINQLFTVKIADFGAASEVKDAKNLTGSEFGTLLWQAPELYRHASLTKESDIYSFGVILGELVTRKLPENYNDIHQIITLKSKGSDNINFYQPQEISSSNPTDSDKMICHVLWDLSLACQSLNPKDRPDLDSIIKILQGSLNYVKENSSSKKPYVTPLFNDPSTSALSVVKPSFDFIQEEEKPEVNKFVQISNLFTIDSPLSELSDSQVNEATKTDPEPKNDNFSLGQCFLSFFKNCTNVSRQIGATLSSDEASALVMTAVDFIEQTRFIF